MTKYIYYKDSKYIYLIFVILCFIAIKNCYYFYSNSLYYFK
nr:MAG TPA: hypothetical protein [Caudoviricetes sp.]